jgi:hypothetical protein
VQNLTPEVVYAVERAACVISGRWEQVDLFTAATHQVDWVAPVTGVQPTAYYRLRSK